MSSGCCICQLRVRNVQNIFEMRLGNSPPVLIGDLVVRLTSGTRHTFGAGSKICRRCCDKVLRWHNSIRIAQQLQHEVLQLLDEADKQHQRETLKEEEEYDSSEEYVDWIESKEEEEDLEDVDAEVDEPSKTEIIRFECELNPDEDQNDFEHQEANTTNIETTEIKFIVEEDDGVDISEDDEDFGEICYEPDVNDESIEYMLNSPKKTKKTYDEMEDDNYEVNDEHIDDDDDDDDDDEDEDYVEPKQTKKRSVPIPRPATSKKNKIAASRILDLKCSECDKSFKNKRQFNAHIKKDHFAGFICDQCGKTLQSYSGFVNHRENHNPVKTLECPECGERFHLKSRLRHHMAWHSGEKPYQCETCSKRFVHRVALQRHVRIHDDSSRRLECEICGFKFRTKPHLVRHMATHTGAKPHSCPVCGKCFAQLYNMRVHVQEHEQPGSTRQRRLKCKKCAHTFINKENYQEHCKRGDCEATTTA